MVWADDWRSLSFSLFLQLGSRPEPCHPPSACGLFQHRLRQSMLAIHIYCSEEAIEYILQEGWGMASLRQQQQAGLHAGYPSFQRHQRFAEPCCARFRFGQ